MRGCLFFVVHVSLGIQASTHCIKLTATSIKKMLNGVLFV